NGIPRRHLAAFDIASGATLPWNPSPDGDVTSLVASGDRVYIAGGFTTIAGVPRDHAAQIDITTGSALPWAPRIDGRVESLVRDRGELVAVGSFSAVNGLPRPYAAALDTVTGHPSDWRIPFMYGSPNFAAAGPNGLYMGGPYVYTVGGAERGGTAA